MAVTAVHPEPRTAVRCAVTWVGEESASVARTNPEGTITTCDIERRGAPEPIYLAMIVRAIGDRDRVVILGPGDMRLALEREYVAIHHRPDRLVDVEPADAGDRERLVERLRTLTT
jgi:hypothetical protein